MRMSLSQFPICIISPRSKKKNGSSVFSFIHCKKCVPFFFFFFSMSLQSKYICSLSLSLLFHLLYIFFLSFRYLFFFHVYIHIFFFFICLDHFCLRSFLFPQDRLDTEINILHMNKLRVRHV